MAKYIDADLLRKEIERRITDNTFGAKLELIDILAFIDSLPEQAVERLEENDFVEEVRQYYSNNCTWDALKQPMLSIITRCARHFAEWGRKQVLQDIYEGKCKPVDLITSAWLED